MLVRCTHHIKTKIICYIEPCNWRNKGSSWSLSCLPPDYCCKVIKIVTTVHELHPELPHLESMCQGEVYSLSTNSWRRVDRICAAVKSDYHIIYIYNIISPRVWLVPSHVRGRVANWF